MALVDIQDSHFNAHEYRREFDAMVGQLHLQDSKGVWYIGMDASRALYAVLGYRRLVKISCFFMHGLMNTGYRFFARRRIKLGQWWEKRLAKR